MKRLLLLATAALALAGSAHAQEMRIVDDGSHFSWRIIPTWMDISDVLNRYVAGNTPQDATTTVECTINKGYRPDGCVIVEQPAPDHLSKSAIDIAKLYRAYSTDNSGKSTIGRRVRLSFRFGGSVF